MKDIIIISLRWIKDQALNGTLTTGEQLINHLIQTEVIRPDDPGLHRYLKKLHTQLTDSTYETQPGFMKLDAYLALLDHDEFDLARKDSAEAMKQARRATILAVVSIIIGSVIGIIQIIVSVKCK